MFPLADNRPLSEREQNAAAVVGILVIFSFLYSVLVLRTILFWFWLWMSIATVAIFLYLLWRFVRAHERIAAALEAGEAGGADSDDQGP